MNERSAVDETLYQSQGSIDMSAEMEAAISGVKQGIVADAKAALAVLTKIMNDETASPEVRVQAATYVAGAAMQREHLEEFRRQQESTRGRGESDA